MTRRIDWLMWLALAIVAVPAAAHPGHGRSADSSSLTHYATEPTHAILLLIAVVVIAAIAASGWIVRQIGQRATKARGQKG